MNFNDLLKRYKEGKASEEEIKIIEEELKKYQAIEDYISENIEDDLNGDLEMDFDFSLPEDSSARDESNIIQKNVNKRLRKVVITSVSIVLAIYFIVFVIISPVVDSFFYNPTKISVGENHEDFSYDMIALTRLNMPGTALFNSYAEKKGFGKYKISINRRDLFHEAFEELNLEINRNMRNSFKFLESRDQPPFLLFISNLSDSFIKENNQKTIEHIKELNPVSYISSYITFKEDLTMRELIDLNGKYLNDDIQLMWAGIRTEPKITYEDSEGYNPMVTGFSLDFGSGFSLSDDIPDPEKYPAYDWMNWAKKDSNTYNLSTFYEIHYKTLLKYAIDRKTAVDTIEGAFKNDHYKDSLDYVEKNGVKTFGVLIYANARDLLKFVENENIEIIQVNEVLASKKNFGIY